MFEQKLEKQVYVPNVVIVKDGQVMVLASYGIIAGISLEMYNRTIKLTNHAYASTVFMDE